MSLCILGVPTKSRYTLVPSYGSIGPSILKLQKFWVPQTSVKTFHLSPTVIFPAPQKFTSPIGILQDKTFFLILTIDFSVGSNSWHPRSSVSGGGARRSGSGYAIRVLVPGRTGMAERPHHDLTVLADHRMGDNHSGVRQRNGAGLGSIPLTCKKGLDTNCVKSEAVQSHFED